MDAEAMREMGYRAIDLAIELMGEKTPVVRAAEPALLAEMIDAALPETATSFEAIESDLRDSVFAFRARADHPGYLAFIPGSSTWPGALADFLASALNIDTCWWLGGAGPSQVELVVLDWFRDFVGYPQGAAGVLVSGGSAANITALACARETLVGAMSDDLVIYASDQTHSSNARAARLLGFRPDQMRILPTGPDLRLRPESLRRAVAADRAAGRRPLIVIANAGTTNTGAIDPLDELATCCEEDGLWLHVDGAYGGFAVLDRRGAEALRGLDRADSVALDPHKWLFQPFECGALLVRNGSALRRAFEIIPDYLRDVEAEDGEVNFSDRGLQLTRGFRALKVWMSMRYFGAPAFREAIGRAIDLAERAAACVEAAPNLELLAPQSLGIVAFRRTEPGADDAHLNDANLGLVAELEAGGESFVSSTRIHGRTAARICILNHTTTWADVERVLHLFETAPLPAPAERAPAPERHVRLERSWAARAQLDAESVRSIHAFIDLPDADVRTVLDGAHVLTVDAGENIVEQWEASREVYGILDGVVQLTHDGQVLAALKPGDHFGEIAALDWGAGYGYARIATARAVTTTRLLVVEHETVLRLMRTNAAVAQRFEQSARERRQATTGTG
jgi:glutamate/tyrosine decarboxylase-like PLP-dependent enzyme